MAAACCLRLPEETGVPLSVSRLEQPRLPAIMVGEGFSALLTTAFLRETEQAVAQLECNNRLPVPDKTNCAGVGMGKRYGAGE